MTKFNTICSLTKRRRQVEDPGGESSDGARKKRKWKKYESEEVDQASEYLALIKTSLHKRASEQKRPQEYKIKSVLNDAITGIGRAAWDQMRSGLGKLGILCQLSASHR